MPCICLITTHIVLILVLEVVINYNYDFILASQLIYILQLSAMDISVLRSYTNVLTYHLNNYYFWPDAFIAKNY